MLLDPTIFWIALGVVLVVGVFVEFHKERTKREALEKLPRPVIEKALRDGWELKAKIQHGVVGGKEAVVELITWELRAGNAVQEKAAPYLDWWQQANAELGSTSKSDFIAHLDPLLGALSEIARQL